MIEPAVALTFVTTIAIIVSMAYVFSGGRSGTASRLEKQWHPSSPATAGQFAERQSARAGRVLSDLGKLISKDSKNQSRMQQKMIRAGFRRPEAAMALIGGKIVFFVALVSLVYVSGLYAVNPMSLLIAAVLGYLLPDMWLSRRISQRQQRIRLGLPDALDLLVIAVEAGLGLDQAMLRVSQELKIIHPEVSQELGTVNLEMQVGKGRVEAFRALATRTGVDDVKSLVATLIQTERFGTSVTQSLRVQADSLRTKRRQRAEEQAAKTPVKLVPVLVFFIFPALFVVILGPAVIGLTRQMMPALAK